MQNVAMDIDLDIEVQRTTDEARVPGLGWTLPEETRQAMKEIDENIRTAEQMSGNIFVG